MRKFKAGSLSILITSALLLSACGAGNTDKASKENGGSNGASANAGQTVIGTWGGDYQQLLKENVDSALVKDQPNSKVVYATGDETSRMTKMRAEKSGAGTYDVVHQADYEFQELINDDLLTKLDYSKMPNASHVRSTIKNDYFIPHIYSASVIVYNKDKVKPAPDSWKVLWDQQYKGKVGILNSLWTSWLYAAAAVDGKNNTSDWEGSWKTLVKITDMKPKVYATQEELGQALQTGEVTLGISYRSRAVQWSQAGGEPLGNVVPKEGSYSVVFGAAVPKNSKNPDGGYAYMNAMLDQKGQAGFAEKMGYAPTVDNAQLSDELKSTIDFTEDEAARIKAPDLKYIAENNAKWKEKFEKEILSK